jgi:WD40 repeat protein
MDIAFSPDGSILAMGDALWRVEDGERFNEVELEFADRFHQIASSLAFSPDGETLALGFGQAGLALWNFQEGVETSIRELQVPEGWVTGVSFSPDGNILASVSAFPDYVVQILDISQGESLFALRGENFWRVAFSPDGDVIATISVHEEGGELSPSPSGSIQVWNASDGDLIRRLDINDASSIAFSPDGTILATGSADGMLRLWQVETGDLLVELDGHADYLTGLAFSPDGELIASSSNDGTVILWGIP